MHIHSSVKATLMKQGCSFQANLSQEEFFFTRRNVDFDDQKYMGTLKLTTAREPIES